MHVLPLIVRPCAWLLEPDLARLQARPTDGRPLSIGSDSQIDSDLAMFVYELAAKIDELSGSVVAKEANRHDGYRASWPNPRRQGSAVSDDFEAKSETVSSPALANLPPEWAGFYKNDRAIRLVITEANPSTFRARMEYPNEGTVTTVEGKIVLDAADTEVYWAKLQPRAGYMRVSIPRGRLCTHVYRPHQLRWRILGRCCRSKDARSVVPRHSSGWQVRTAIGQHEDKPKNTLRNAAQLHAEAVAARLRGTTHSAFVQCRRRGVTPAASRSRRTPR